MLNLAAWRSGSLPRDTRDTLFLLAVVGWVLLMQVGHIPVWCAAMAVAVLGWRAHITLRGRPLPAWPWRLTLLAITLAATWMTHRTLLGRDAGVTLIVVLLALKTLEMRARRDAFVVFFLAFFTLLTHFFYSQSLLTAAGILLALLGLLTALVNAHMPVGHPPLRQSAWIAGRMALLGAPVMLVLFMLFPRMAPLWGTPSDAMTGRTGLSGEMQVGQVARLAADDGIAMRVRFDGEIPPMRDLYFRGPVLSDFDGVRWRPLRSGFPASMEIQAELQPLGQPVDYEITMEPSFQPWLVMLEAAVEPPELPRGRAFMTPDLQWMSTRPVTDLMRFRGRSHLAFRHGPRQSTVALQDFTELPGGFNPRTLALAQSLRHQYGAGPAVAPRLVEAALERLRTGGYTYTLDPGVYGRDTADEFWFDRKEGFCEHIASSFVILMRAMDIPARVVTGYQGGELNAMDNYWVVRQRDAHAWAEVWLAGEGWVRVDPTGAVSPSRLGSLTRLAAPEGLVAGTFRNLNPTLTRQLRDAWEAINNRWNQWVLNYTQGRQLDLLRHLGFDSPSWRDLLLALALVVGTAGLAGALWMLWERQQHDPWLRLLDRARRQLEQQGLPAVTRPTPRELARQTQQHWGDTARARAIRDWLLRLEAQRYSAAPGASLATLRREFRQIPWTQTTKT